MHRCNLFGLKRYEETIMKGNQFLAQYPELSNEDNFTIRMNIGMAMYRSQYYDDAVSEFKRVLALNDIYISSVAQMAIGDCSWEQKKYDAALEAFATAKELASLNSDNKIIEIANQKIKNIKKIQADNIKK